MKSRLFRFTLYSIIVHLIYTVLNPALAAPPPQDEIGAHFCGFTGLQPDSHLSDSFPNRRYSRTLANLDVGEPRTVRLIYFLPNDRPFRTSVVQRLKDDIPKIQTFYAQQMGAHGYGFRTFRIESDSKGEPMIHRVDGRHPESHYLNDATSSVVEEIGTVFNLDANIYLIIFDNSSGSIGRSAKRIGGFGARTGKDSGFALVPEPFDGPHVHVMAHEFGHAFGLYHDFNNRAYLMSYGAQSQSRLSACHAEYLAVHSYFNPDSTIADAPPPTIELISPLTYPAGSESVPVHLKLTYSDGLHQVFLLRNGAEVWGCRGLAGEKHAVAEFDYDGFGGESADWNNVIGLRDSDIHHITALSVDVDGNVGWEDFTLSATESTHPRPQTLLKISEDNQQGQANTQLPYPLVVEVRDQNDNPLPNAQVTFSVIAGVGRLSGRFTLENAMTDANGRAEQPFTPGPGTNIVEATIQLQPGRIQPVAIFKVIGIGASTVPVMVGDYQRWHLPEGATRRLGKGRIGTSDRSVAFSPDGQLLAVASGIGVWLYDVAMARELALLSSASRVHSVAFSIDGKMLAAGVQGWYPDGGVVLWDVTTHKQIAALPARDYVESTSVSFSPDGGTIAFRSVNGMVKMWDVTTGNVATLEEKHGPESGGLALTPDSYLVFNPLSVSFSPDGRLLASGSHDGTVKLWEVETQTLIVALSGHRLGVSSVSFSHDGKLLASGSIDETVKLWDVLAREYIDTLRGHTRQVSSVSFSRDGRLLVSGASGVIGGPDSESGSDATIKLWDVATKQNIDTFGPHPRGIYAVSVSPRGNLLASGSADGTVKLWDVSTGNVEFEISGHASMGKSVSFSPVEMSLASGSRDGTVTLWDVATGRDVEIFGPHALGVNAVSFSRDGMLLASGSHDRTVKLWDVKTGTSIASRFTYGCGGQVYSVSFSPDGAILASGDANGVLLWSPATGDQISTPAGFASWVYSVSFSPNPNSSVLAFGSGFGAKLWEVATHTPIATLGNASKVDSVSFSLVEPILATAGRDQDHVTLWDLLTREKIGTLAGQDVFIESISFSPDGTILAAGTRNNTVKVWDVATHTPLATLEGHTGKGVSGVTSVSFSLDGTLLASGSDHDGTVLLWDLTALTLSLPLSGDETIPDFNLRSAIRNTLGKSVGDPIVPADVGTLTDLQARGTGIIDLAGLELATNLLELDLGVNSVADISALSGMTKLETLNLASNSLSDISAMGDLTNLTTLILKDNAISDLSPLIGNSGLGRGDQIDVRANPLNYASIHTHIPTLQSRGVEVEFDNRTPQSIRIVSGEDQQDLPNTSLENPFVVEVRDQSDKPLPGVQVTFAVSIGGGTLSVTSATTDGTGRAESILTLGPNPGTNTVSVSVTGLQEAQSVTAISEPPPIPQDVNRDDVVNILDLVLVASVLGTEGLDLAADVNGDGVVNILDLVLIAGALAGALGDAAAAPSAQAPEILTAADVRTWLTDARSLAGKDAMIKKGIVVLEQLLVALTPSETALLLNFPNPFNPETWIPYQLAENANVTLTIYDTTGSLVYQLDLGHQLAGYYTDRTKAAYWDGRNESGEPVASGLYFYQLATPSYRHLRRMVILK